jgi:hypothetical protein
MFKSMFCDIQKEPKKKRHSTIKNEIKVIEKEKEVERLKHTQLKIRKELYIAIRNSGLITQTRKRND